MTHARFRADPCEESRVALLLVLLAAALAVPPPAAGQAGSDPVPVPGGFHFFTPGPRRLGYQGLHVEPGTILDFRGDVAVAYLTGTAEDDRGNRYLLGADMRVLRGDYVGFDGFTRRGVFGFV
jgi:hypothetical protein